ncbi:MAG: tetratricopeptide repeat protein [Mucispirillum sp.]|nr:tetratricopeptide repeat protein [Mucispirillum sp.]
MDERTHARYMSDIAYFLSKMEEEPNSGYFIPIALAYNKLEKYDETITMCKSAVERFPSNCAAKTLLAEAYIYKGDFDQARELLFDVTAEDDHNYKALKLLGVICKEREESAEALKYLTGAYIRAPEDADIRKMIEDLGGTLNPSEIYDEREKKQKQNVAESEDDEELRTYMDIDQKIRSAEIIMAELVSDTSITSGAAYEDDDFDSDDPNDFMPTISTVEYEDEEEDEEIVPEDVLTVENDTAANNAATQSAEENDNDSLDVSSESGDDGLTAALSGDSGESDEESDDLTAALSEGSEDDIDD